MHTGNDPQGPATAQGSADNALPRVTDPLVLSEFASGFAHQLNQPLAAIAAYAASAATLIRRDPENARQTLGIIQAIAGQALRAGVVIEELRGITRPLPPDGPPVDTNAVVAAALPLLRSLASRRAVDLIVELRTPVVPVRGDAARLHAVLVLLLVGALDAVGRLPSGRERLTICTDDSATGVSLAGRWRGNPLFHVELPRFEP